VTKAGRKTFVAQCVHAVEAVGKTVAGVEFFPDGRLRVLTTDADLDAPSPVASGGWTDNAGEKAVHRA
jgi:hypothetical protein